MAEGDTVHRSARHLRAAMAGRELLKTDFRIPSMAVADLSGQEVQEVEARGKHLLLRTDGGLTVHSHLGMDGRWDLYRDGERWRGPEHEIRAALWTEPWEAVALRPRMLEVIPSNQEVEVVGHLGPDPLGPDWDPDEALRRLLSWPEREVGVAVMDQRVMSGPGNVYKSEVLFLRGVHPRMAVGGVRDPAGLVSLIKRLMDANRDTRRRATTGVDPPGERLWVYGRAWKACHRCNTPIRSLEQGDRPAERMTYFCPSCQPAAAG